MSETGFLAWLSGGESWIFVLKPGFLTKPSEHELSVDVRNWVSRLAVWWRILDFCFETRFLDKTLIVFLGGSYRGRILIGKFGCWISLH